MKMLRPEIGSWYKDVQTSALFEVIDWDPSTLIIETQYLDGEVSEYDLDAWREMTLTHVEAPEDWRSPYEMSDEDGLDPDSPMHPEDWNNPLNMIEPDIVYGLDDY